MPIVTPAEMGRIDAEAPEPVDVLIARAGSAVARTAVEMMGGTYGRRVVVLPGKGNNGNDGRDAARRLRGRGVRVRRDRRRRRTIAAPGCDLVIDAAFGTGFRGTFRAPRPMPGTAVLAVDIPSGVDGLTGEQSEQVLAADATVTFAALKPGLVFGAGLGLAGRVRVADIGLDTGRGHQPPGRWRGGRRLDGWAGTRRRTSGAARCGSSPGARGWAVPPRCVAPRPPGRERATCA